VREILYILRTNKRSGNFEDCLARAIPTAGRTGYV
jgi:hypothetical protein